jgi:hypothetical protein
VLWEGLERRRKKKEVSIELRSKKVWDIGVLEFHC